MRLAVAIVLAGLIAGCMNDSGSSVAISGKPFRSVVLSGTATALLDGNQTFAVMRFMAPRLDADDSREHSQFALRAISTDGNDGASAVFAVSDGCIQLLAAHDRVAGWEFGGDLPPAADFVVALIGGGREIGVTLAFAKADRNFPAQENPESVYQRSGSLSHAGRYLETGGNPPVFAGVEVRDDRNSGGLGTTGAGALTISSAREYGNPSLGWIRAYTQPSIPQTGSVRVELTADSESRSMTKPMDPLGGQIRFSGTALGSTLTSKLTLSTESTDVNPTVSVTVGSIAWNPRSLGLCVEHAVE